MRFVYRNPEVEAELAAANSYDSLDAAFRKMRALIPSFLTPQIRGRQMFCPGFDALVPQIARKLGLTDVPLEKSNDNTVIVATRFYLTGGHSRVAADISQLIGGERTSLVLTDADGQLRWNGVINTHPFNDLFKKRATVLLAAQTLPEKAVELYMTLAAIRPSRIFLMANHMDMAATVGCWPFRSVVEFVHHADHMPVLGATLPFSAHADLTYTCHLACKEAGTHPVYAGMTLEQRPQPAASAARPAGQRPRIATCGTLYKYRQPARYRWSDFAVAALQAADADFIHIGDSDEGFVAEMAAALTVAGLDPARYQMVGRKPDLRQALIDENVDFYMASYPDSGGRAILEALDAGLAPLVPVPDEQGDLLHFDLPLKTWVRITAPDQVAAALGEAETLSREVRSPEGRAALAREFSRFEDYVVRGAPPPA